MSDHLSKPRTLERFEQSETHTLPTVGRMTGVLQLVGGTEALPGCNADDPDRRRDLDQFVHVVLSRAVGEMRGKRSGVWPMSAAVAGIARQSYRRGTSKHAAACPDLIGPFSSGPGGLKAQKLVPAMLDAKWKRAKFDNGVYATLPRDLVESFFRPKLWPAVAQMVVWGPTECTERLTRFLSAEAEREVPTTRARPAGGNKLAAGTIDVLATGGFTLMRLICEMNSLGYNKELRVPLEALAQWQKGEMPRRPDSSTVDAMPADTDRSAPPLLLVRRSMRTLDRSVQDRMRTKVLREQASYRARRRRVLVAIVSTTGARIGSVLELNRKHYDRRHVFPDGSIGPALHMVVDKRSGKSRIRRWKAIADVIADWIEDYLDYLGILDTPEASFWPAQKSGDPRLACSIDGLQGLLVGQLGVQPTFPKPGDPRNGYSPHSLRHLAEQLACASGHDYLEQHPDLKGKLVPQVFADALLDHSMGGDRYGYKDLKSEPGREQWGRLASLGVWDYIWGDRGARKAPDMDRIRALTDRLDEISAAMTDLHLRITHLREQRRTLRETAASGDMPLEKVLALWLQVENISDQLDDEHTEESRLIREQAKTEAGLHKAHETLIAVSDEMSDEDYAAVVSGIPVEPEDDGHDDPAVELRNSLTAVEAAKAWSVSTATMRRWFRRRNALSRRGSTESLAAE